jgi:hypothetical protein
MAAEQSCDGFYRRRLSTQRASRLDWETSMRKSSRGRSTKGLQHIKWRDHTPPFAWLALALLMLFLLLSLIWEIRSASPHSRMRVPFGSDAADA